MSEPVLTDPSPNFTERRDGTRPELIVLHYTAMVSAEAACRALCDPEREVSAHYLICEDGTLRSLVTEEMRAWHAGAGSWGGQGDVNSRSIGIELANDGFSPFSEPLMTTLEGLLADIMARWDIPAHCVIGHSDMAPGRKIDPGARFDWQRLARQGLAIWPEAREGDPARFLDDLHAFGYPRDVEQDVLLAAFRSRFRRGAEGPVDEMDAGLAADLAERFGVDRRDGSS